MVRVLDVSAPKLDDRAQVLVYRVKRTAAEINEPLRTLPLSRMTCQRRKMLMEYEQLRHQRETPAMNEASLGKLKIGTQPPMTTT